MGNLHLYGTNSAHDLDYYDIEEGGKYQEPWVAYIEENGEVTYNHHLLENYDAWNEYKQLFCDEDLNEAMEIFAKYPVTVSKTTSQSGWWQEPDYTDYTTFTAIVNSTTTLVRRVATKYRPYMRPQEYTTNDCGATYYKRYEWGLMETVVGSEQGGEVRPIEGPIN